MHFPSTPGTHRDPKTPGLALRVNPGGSKTWVVVKRGRRKVIGHYPDMSLAEARRRVSMSTGTQTIRAAWAEHFTVHVKPRKRSADQDEYYWDRFVETYVDTSLPLEDLCEVLRTVHATIGTNHGHFVANRVLAVCIQVLKFHDVAPPKVKRFPEPPRTRRLSEDELRKLLIACERSSIGDFVKLLLLTGARSGNVMRMRWDQVCLETNTWTIPADETKSGREQLVHLCARAVDILEARERSTDWVFPGRYHGHPMSRPYKAWRKLCADAGITNLRIHDVRRSLASFMAVSGVPMHVISKTLGHADLATTHQVYAHLSMQPVRDAVDKTVDRLF